MSDLREALKGDDAAAINAKASNLQQRAMKLGEAIHTASQETPGATSSRGDDNVVDAEFTEVEDDDKRKSK